MVNSPSEVSADNSQPESKIVEDLRKPMGATMNMFQRLIDEFEYSEDYLKYGATTQQQLITQWLEDKQAVGVNLTRDNIRTLKELITDHYNITSGRK